jgi:hypothetical protein
LSLEQFEEGFLKNKEYNEFRKRSTIEDYLIEMTNHGLTPSEYLENNLYHILMIPFSFIHGIIFKSRTDFKSINSTIFFEKLLQQVGKIMTSFGSLWISETKPEKIDDVISLTSTAICFMTNIVAIEASRQYGYCLGSALIDSEDIPELELDNWNEVHGNIGADLFLFINEDWSILPSNDNEIGED